MTIFVSNGKVREVPDVVGLEPGRGARPSSTAPGFDAERAHDGRPTEPDRGRHRAVADAGRRARSAAGARRSDHGRRSSTPPTPPAAGTRREGRGAGRRPLERAHGLARVGARRCSTASRRAATRRVPVVIDREGVWRRARSALGTAATGSGEPLARRARAAACSDADVVFPVLHGPFGEDGTVQGLLECVGRSLRGRRRARLGAVHGQGGLQAADGAGGHAAGALRGRDASASGKRDRDAVLERARALGLPQFVKPARLGSSFGISKVTTRGRA